MLSSNVLEFQWSQKYRPKTIDEIILPKYIKDILKGIIVKGDIPNLLFTGTSGIGKTTAVFALLKEMDFDYYKINGSKEGNIDNLRNQISEYASSVSIDGKRKVVFIDEGDNLTHAAQLALRGFMEEVSSNCLFIITCNYDKKIIPELRSRFSEINFRIPNEEKQELTKQFVHRVLEILKLEQVEFEPQPVVLLVGKLFPNFRKTLNELQKESNKGKIGVGVVTNLSKENIIQLVGFVKSKDFSSIKKWVHENSNIQLEDLLDTLYSVMVDKLQESSIPQLVLVLNKYDYQNAFVTNKTLNCEAMLCEIMGSVSFR